MNQFAMALSAVFARAFQKSAPRGPRFIENLEQRTLLAAHPMSSGVQAIGGLPTGWSNTAINARGNASATGGAFTVSGGGAGIGGTSDGFDYCYESLRGDGLMIAHLAAAPTGTSPAQAGLMIRDTVAGGAADATVLLSADGSAHLVDRAQGGTAAAAAPAVSSAGTWLALGRHGSTVTAYASVDGVTWTVVGTDHVAISSRAYIGLAVSSGDATTLQTATFDHVSLQRRTTPMQAGGGKAHGNKSSDTTATKTPAKGGTKDAGKKSHSKEAKHSNPHSED